MRVASGRRLQPDVGAIYLYTAKGYNNDDEKRTIDDRAGPVPPV
jgi:hypothetical protein